MLDPRLRDRFDRKTVTGWEMCPKHKKMKDDGYIALIGIDGEKSEKTRTLDGVWRLGIYMHLKKEAWEKVFKAPVPDKGICFVDNSIIQMLQPHAQEVPV